MLHELVLVVGLVMAVILAAANIIFSVRDAQVVEHLILGVEHQQAGAAFHL